MPFVVKNVAETLDSLLSDEFASCAQKLSGIIEKHSYLVLSRTDRNDAKSRF